MRTSIEPGDRWRPLYTRQIAGQDGGPVENTMVKNMMAHCGFHSVWLYPELEFVTAKPRKRNRPPESSFRLLPAGRPTERERKGGAVRRVCPALTPTRCVLYFSCDTHNAPEEDYCAHRDRFFQRLGRYSCRIRKEAPP